MARERGLYTLVPAKNKYCKLRVLAQRPVEYNNMVTLATKAQQSAWLSKAFWAADLVLEEEGRRGVAEVWAGVHHCQARYVLFLLCCRHTFVDRL